MFLITLVLLAVVSFLQNMAFTFTSRSRNSGDPNYHRRAAWGSNGIWLLNQIFLVKIIWEPVMSGEWWSVLIAGIVYVIFSTEGSVYMMEIMLGTAKIETLKKWFQEKGKRKVGAEIKEEEKTEEVLAEQYIQDNINDIHKVFKEKVRIAYLHRFRPQDVLNAIDALGYNQTKDYVLVTEGADWNYSLYIYSGKSEYVLKGDGFSKSYCTFEKIK